MILSGQYRGRVSLCSAHTMHTLEGATRLNRNHFQLMVHTSIPTIGTHGRRYNLKLRCIFALLETNESICAASIRSECTYYWWNSLSIGGTTGQAGIRLCHEEHEEAVSVDEEEKGCPRHVFPPYGLDFHGESLDVF